MTHVDPATLPLPEVRAALAKHGIDHDVLPCPDELSDTAAFCAHYGVPLGQAANTIVVTSRKTEPAVQAVCVVLGTTRLDVNRKVRELLGVKRASFADAELTTRLTGMKIGGVTPFSLPRTEAGNLPVYVDCAVLQQDHVIMGGGNRTSKIRLAPTELRKLPAVVLVEGLATPAPAPEAPVPLP